MAILNNSNAISTAGGYDINNSLRFRSSANGYLNRTPASAGNQQKWTYSLWLKRGALSTVQNLLVVGTNITAQQSTQFGLNNDNTIQFFDGLAGVSTSIIFDTTQVFRDPSAWYHIILAVDTTQATSTNRVKIYINGSQITAFTSSTYPTQNFNTLVNAASAHYIGRFSNVSTNYFDGYLAETYLIDGQQLTPSSFGETDTTTGSWKPKAYSGTYGTNGFYLKFSDIATTSGSNAGLGKDFSGNANYWTTNNISVTAGTTYDAMIDSPTLTSATVANYPVMSPIMAGGITVTDGNLSVQKVGASYGNTNSTIAFPASGKYYFEITIVSGSNGNNQQMGMGTQGGSYYFVLDCYYSSNLIRKVADGTATTGYGTASAGTVIGVAVDADNGKAYLAINNTWIDSSSPTGGTGGYSMTSGQVYSGFFQAYNSGVSAYNFGQRPFTYTPPTGYKALNAYNLPDSTIKKGSSYMDATTYTGNNTTNNIVNAGGFKPDLIWIKDRGRMGSHVLVDSVRGVTKALSSESTATDTAYSFTQLSSINSNGFTLAANTTSDAFYVNINSDTFVGWQWQAGQGTTSSNTSGNVTSTVSVNTTAGFSIVTYTVTSTAGMTIGHGLGVAPKLIIEKTRGSSANWDVYHASLGNTGRLLLNTTGAFDTQAGVWNNTSPTSTVFSQQGNGGWHAVGTTCVAYCWTEIAGFSKFGSYTGNGSTDGTFVYTGFRPKYVLIKNATNISGGGNWCIKDSSRGTYNANTPNLIANNSDAEYQEREVDFLSNGFKIRDSNGNVNYNGATIIYAAFAENPFKNANAR